MKHEVDPTDPTPIKSGDKWRFVASYECHRCLTVGRLHDRAWVADKASEASKPSRIAAKPSLRVGYRQRANGYVLMGTKILGIQAQNGSEWLGEWLRRLFGGSRVDSDGLRQDGFLTDLNLALNVIFFKNWIGQNWIAELASFKMC